MRNNRRKAVTAREQGAAAAAAAAAAAKRARFATDVDNVKTDSSGEVRSFMWQNEDMMLAHYANTDDDNGVAGDHTPLAAYEMLEIPNTAKAALPPPIERVDSHIYVPAGFGKRSASSPPPPSPQALVAGDIIDVESINSDTEFVVERAPAKTRAKQDRANDGYAPLPKGIGNGNVYNIVEPLPALDAGLHPNSNYDILVVDDPYVGGGGGGGAAASSVKAKNSGGGGGGAGGKSRPDFDAARRRRPPTSEANKNRTNYIDCEQPFDN